MSAGTPATIGVGVTLLLVSVMTGCLGSGHVPNTSPEVERQLRAELAAKHLAIWEFTGLYWLILPADGSQSPSGPASWASSSVGITLGTTDNGRYVLYMHDQKILTIDKDGRVVRSVQSPCYGALAQDLRHVACEGPCDCDVCGELRCFSIAAHPAIATRSEYDASRSSMSALIDGFA